MRHQSLATADRRAEETIDLLRRAQTSPPGEQGRLQAEAVEMNMGVAASVARRYARRGEPLDDLLQVAYVGLTKAAHRFDPERGHDFLAYAVPTMSGEIKRHFRDAGWSVRPPRRIQELQPHIFAAAAELTQRHGGSPRPSDIADELDVDVADVTEALATGNCFAPASLDDPGGRADGSSIRDRVGSVEPGFDHAEAIAMLRPACRHLERRDRRILYLRFYLGWTQAQIAGELGVSQMHVSRLLQRILGSLRTSLEPDLE